MSQNPIPAEPVLAGQIAIVTGASRGLGQATALARMGATVIVNHKRNPDLAEAICTQIGEFGGTAVPMQANVTQPAEVQAMIAVMPCPPARLTRRPICRREC